jgi:hypothetical protein
MFAKKMGARILALCVQKDSGRLWFSRKALCSLRKSPLIHDSYESLNRLKKAGIIEWRHNENDTVTVEFKGWSG